MLRNLEQTMDNALTQVEQQNVYDNMLQQLAIVQLEGEHKLSRATVENILLTHFFSEWDDETKVIQENENPVWLNSESGKSDVQEFARITVRITTNKHDSFGFVGNRRMQRTGRIFVQLFVKQGMKTSRINELSTKVVEIYESISFSRVRILEITESFLANGTGETNTASSKSDGVWFGKLVNVLFQFDEVK